jgi:hypothetical protein
VRGWNNSVAAPLSGCWVAELGSLSGITRTVMDNSFCRFPQTRFWHELRRHLAALPGVTVTSFEDMPIAGAGSWLDFTFRGHSFTINAESGEFVFFVEDTDCPASVRAEVAAHFESLLGDGGDNSLRRV